MNAKDMSTPVTRAELRDELNQAKSELHGAIAKAVEPLATKVELHEAIAKAVAPLATKVELHTLGHALLERIESNERRMDAQFAVVNERIERLQVELVRHVNAGYEAMRKEFRALDDKYSDLPPRVARLERTVFPDQR